MDPCFHLCSTIPRKVGQKNLALSSAGAMALAPWSLTLGKADLYLPWRPLSVFHCVFAGAVRTAWNISQVQGVEGPPTSFQAHLALHCGLEGGIHHCRVNSLGHISAMKHYSCIKQSPPGSPPHTSSLHQVPLHDSTGCPV